MSMPTANCWSFSNVVSLRSTFGVPLYLLWFFYGMSSFQMSNGSLFTLPWRKNVIRCLAGITYSAAFDFKHETS